MKVPQPFPYQGSKRALAPLILPYLPGDCATFYEPFSGSAAMTIAVAARGLAKRYVINDINEPLANLWRYIIDEPKDLASGYTALWKKQIGREIEFYNEVRTEFNSTHKADHFLFLLARCVKAAIRYNQKGEFNQSPDPRRCGMIPSTMRGNLLATSALLHGKTDVCSVDYVALCAKCYWAYPDNYKHIAMKEIRRLDLMWIEDEITEYDAIKEKAKNAAQEMPGFVKKALRNLLNSK